MYKSAGTQGGQNRKSDTLELELQAVSCEPPSTDALGVRLRSSANAAVFTLNHSLLFCSIETVC